MQLISFGELENFHAVREQHEEFGQHELKKTHLFGFTTHLFKFFIRCVVQSVD